MKHIGLRAVGLFVLSAVSLVFACGGNAENTGSDSNTHWLEECDSDGDCDGLSCLCGVCTQTCAAQADCSPFGKQAACDVPSSCASPTSAAACVTEALGRGGSSSGGGSSGSAGTAPGPDCLAMDAQSAAPGCTGVIGFAFNGDICAPIACRCEGVDCVEMFDSFDACDRAYSACYARVGVTRSCSSHGDCRIQPRTCCSACNTPERWTLIATNHSSETPRDAQVCLGDPSEECGLCDPLDEAELGLYPACVEGQCTILDVVEEATCQTSDQCQLVSKDCCECPGDARSGLVAVSKSATSLPFCADQTCAPCTYEPDQQVGVSCNLDRGKCEMFVTTL
jgi:hypothetical protein